MTKPNPPRAIPPWRPCPFRPGASYRVLKTFAAMRDSFEAGEELRFVRDAWSRYDGVTGYFFRDTAGRDRVWDIVDDEDIAVWQELFAEMGNV